MPILFAYNNQIWNAFTIFLQEAQEEEKNIGNVHQHIPCVNTMFCIWELHMNLSSVQQTSNSHLLYVKHWDCNGGKDTH